MFYQVSLNGCDIGSGEVNVRCAVDRYVQRKVEEHQMQGASFLPELLFYIRDDHQFFGTMSVLLAKNVKHLVTISVRPEINDYSKK